MTKEEHIRYWLKNAKRDWKRAEWCFEGKDYVFALFCIHLCLEKISKALWVKHHKSNHPPKIHNLLYLLKHTQVHLDDEQKEFLVLMNQFQLEGRYPDYKDKIYRFCTKGYTGNILEKAKKIKQWLQSEL